MSTLISLAVYAAGVFISWKYCAGYWVVGPVFAAEVLLINFSQLKKSELFRYVLFAVLSTVIYALVYRMRDAIQLNPEWLEILVGSWTAAIVMGSILMPAIHAFLFEADVKNARQTALFLILSWYAVLLFAFVDDKFHLTSGNYNMLLAIALWQGIYLRRLKLRG